MMTTPDEIPLTGQTLCVLGLEKVEMFAVRLAGTNEYQLRDGTFGTLRAAIPTGLTDSLTAERRSLVDERLEVVPIWLVPMRQG